MRKNGAIGLPKTLRSSCFLILREISKNHWKRLDTSTRSRTCRRCKSSPTAFWVVSPCGSRTAKSRKSTTSKMKGKLCWIVWKLGRMLWVTNRFTEAIAPWYQMWWSSVFFARSMGSRHGNLFKNRHRKLTHGGAAWVIWSPPRVFLERLTAINQMMAFQIQHARIQNDTCIKIVSIEFCFASHWQMQSVNIRIGISHASSVTITASSSN